MDDANIESVRSIKPISSDTVHKICSGQVVLSLAVAVKELVENSLDAGATNVEVKLKDYGKELIEVSDNGYGVTEDNFAALTLKYHTSKLCDYSDLLGVSSFGFRGEALSSLCNLADLSITTRHKNSSYATKILYDHKGNITSKTPCSRQVGTTVTLSNLFSTLPVRQKEFHKNLKREFTKMTSLLYAYCLISTGVKITCSNQTSSNARTLIVATQGSSLYKDNIACVFGIKQMQSLLEIKTEYVSNIKDNILKGLSNTIQDKDESEIIDDVEIDLSEDSNDTVDNEIPNSQDTVSSQKSQGYINKPNPVELVGFVSSCAHGSGRSTTDRQYYYVNSRPCEPTKVIKIINEVYKQYNPHQYPFVFLNIIIERTSVDVNVTPDKRQVFLTQEKGVMNVVKASLLKLFENIPRTIKLESIEAKNSSVEPELSQPRIFNSFLNKFSRKNGETPVNNNENLDLKRKSSTLIDYGVVKKSYTKSKEPEYDEENDTLIENVNDTLIEEEEFKDKSNDETILEENNEVEKISTDDKNNADKIMYLEHSNELPNTQIRNISDVIIKSHQIYCKTKSLSEKPHKPSLAKIKTDNEELGKFVNRKAVTLKTSIEHVEALFKINMKHNKDKAKPERIKFKTAINPVFNKKCEEELSKEISKESFKKMEIIGQFNLGFIITLLDDDLFIIDQHATDEIYNFETLQKTTELTCQKLVVPQKLELTGVNEQILMDNLDVFKKNGFTFEIDKDALPTKRIKLLTIPMSKNWVFGKDDIEELLFMLRENYHEHCRPSRVRAMFASRACRKSVMIGTALGKSDMRKLVDHMAEIEQPWNCPHGRPTIRHLVNIAMVQTRED